MEITKSWDDKNIDGHCVGDSHPTAARTHHLHVARPLLALHSHKTPRAKSPLHACTLLCMHAPSAGEYEGAEFMPGDRVPLAWSTWPLGSAPARLLRLLMCAWRLWAARHSQGEARALGAQPLPRVLQLAAFKAADFTAFDHSGGVGAGCDEECTGGDAAEA